MIPRPLLILALVSLAAGATRAHHTDPWNTVGWDAADTGSYDHSFSAFYDGRTSNYRAFWCATEGGLNSERAVTSTSSNPWGFSSTPTTALATTGVRVVRAGGVFSGRLDHYNFVDQTLTGSSYASGLGYTVDGVIGYLRRTKLTGVATARIDECVINSSTHFTSKMDNDGTNTECSGAGGTPVTLGYAYNSSTAASGLSERYRCVNPSSPYNHFTTSSSTCEGSGYTNEGSLGYWRSGATGEYYDGAYREVSPYPDGAYVCPSAVIRDGDYYMLYTASARFYAGGPFNQVFMATSPSTDGVTFTPVVDASGDPVPVISYRSGYPSEVIGRGNATEFSVAFGVGGARLAKVGSTFYYTYIDSSHETGGTAWYWKQSTSSTVGTSLSSPSRLKDGSTYLSSNDLVASVPVALYDENPGATNKWWMFSNNHARDEAYYTNNTDGSTGLDYTVSGYSGRQLQIAHSDPSSLWALYSVHGAMTNDLGNVDTRYGWYVYAPHSSTSCSGNDCGVHSIGVTLFDPSALSPAALLSSRPERSLRSLFRAPQPR